MPPVNLPKIQKYFLGNILLRVFLCLQSIYLVLFRTAATKRRETVTTKLQPQLSWVCPYRLQCGNRLINMVHCLIKFDIWVLYKEVYLKKINAWRHCFIKQIFLSLEIRRIIIAWIKKNAFSKAQSLTITFLELLHKLILMRKIDRLQCGFHIVCMRCWNTSIQLIITNYELFVITKIIKSPTKTTFTIVLTTAISLLRPLTVTCYHVYIWRFAGVTYAKRYIHFITSF